MNSGTSSYTQNIGSITAGSSNTIVAGTVNSHNNTTTNIYHEDSPIDRAPRASGASFASAYQSKKASCLKGTRVKLLEEIEQWSRDPNSPPIFWLAGFAGSGKSTISRTLARKWFEEGRIVGSFFSSRDEQDLRQTKKLFSTLAYQLTRLIRSLKEPVN